MPTVLSHAEPIARKPHVCDECFTAIRPGERYVRQGNVDDDGKYTHKAHSDCHARSMSERYDGDRWSPLAEWDYEWVDKHHPKETE